MRIISLNLNGIRSAATKGALKWLGQQHADVICVQELKAQESDLSDEHLAVVHNDRSMAGHFYAAKKKGYSGVGLYSAIAPTRIVRGIGVEEFDDEGRVLRADFDSAKTPVSVVSLYLPSGSASEDRQASKFRFLDVFFPVMSDWMNEHRKTGREFILCGDWNIAHKEIDLKNWKGNLKNSGFLPEERAWLTRIFDELGWVDVFRQLDQRPDQYTWWSQRGQARAKNVGWRIDYQIATPGIAALAQSTFIHTADKFSDHAPLVIDY
ncbi:MAG: exodeoxyribonuclease III [Burkholderiaceae bacterium]|nr:exodeoxyribonuclease III [Burkholderiaceae bacterium]